VERHRGHIGDVLHPCWHSFAKVAHPCMSFTVDARE
jgi:hypothetical protein